ncbi:threonine-phosphate decarboxylase CobD [Thalassospira mesophila]|uniref:threonine-phosphate decarboxylase n=1 Tax=Thalassospira mesophila TaxID=1293891 RepID=A0A1Y2KWT9_9PROT|nr:threonine-phosphate decarboxylase CobD [Thalassospira mesophila]OSQ36148.1 hypothetical protein TMES_18995 [Thalassospira mesophila]
MSDDIFHHGGAIDLAAAHYNIALDEWLDLSTGINPVPYPVGTPSPESWHRLPLKSDNDALVDAAQTCYNVPSSAHIASAPGTQALIQLVPFLLAQTGSVKTAVIFGPTYGEHARAWERAGVKTTEISYPAHTRLSLVQSHDKSGDIIASHDVFVIVNPNNPDGGMIDATSLFDFAKRLQDQGKYLIIDEAFADTVPGISLCSKINVLTHTVVLRSFGKFFGLAGARVGFAITAAPLARQISDRLGPWAIPGPALHIATRALTDTSWQTATRTRLARDASRLDRLICALPDCHLVGGTGLLQLYSGACLPALHHHLATNGIWGRRFHRTPNWLRLGLPGSETDWHRLQSALDEFSPATR